MTAGGIFRPGMRGYFVPLGAGLVGLLLAWVLSTIAMPLDGPVKRKRGRPRKQAPVSPQA